MTLRPFPPSILPTAVLLSAVCGLPAAAQDGPRDPAPARNPAEMLSRADTDGDGKVSKAEFMAARTTEMAQVFGRIDANDDGFIDTEEAEQFASRNRDLAGRRGAGRGEQAGRRPFAERPTGEMAPGEPGAMAEQIFDRMDSDGDGTLSREEYLAGAARLREIMMRRGGQPGLGGRAGAPTEGFRRPPRQEPAGTPEASGS